MKEGFAVSMRWLPIKVSLSVVAMVLVLGWKVGVGPTLAQEAGEVNVSGEFPTVDQIQTEFDGGAQEIQFRDLALTDEQKQQLVDPEFLRDVGNAIPDDGVERHVKFRGTVDGQGFEARIKRQEDGSLRVRIEEMDLTGVDAVGLAQSLRGNGFERVRIRGAGGERIEIRPHGDGTVRARIEGMGLNRDDARALAGSLRENGHDRVRIEGLDDQGRRVRFEWRRDKGVVRDESEAHHRGDGRGRSGTSSEINDDHARDRGRDLDHSLRGRERAEHERDHHERLDRDDHRGRDRHERQERVERYERHGGSGRH